MVVLDTNVVSELMRDRPARGVLDWVRGGVDDELCTTAITVAEIGYGIERLPPGRRKQMLKATAEDVFGNFKEQVLAFDAGAAQYYAVIVAGRDRAGRPMDGFDAQIAAICREHKAALATRNLDDFDQTGIELIDPWQLQ